MNVGIIGLGKMGFNIALNLLNHNHSVVAYDLSDESVNSISKEGAKGVNSIEDLVKQLPERKIIWLMIPSGKAVDSTIEEIIKYINPNDIIIDGGNSNYKDTLRRYKFLKEKGIDFIDCGTSGGTSGALNGACTMIGAEEDVFKYCEELFKDLSIQDGYLHVGKPGSGHFTKMVHNGIEYGMMQSIAEGFEILSKSEFDVDYEKVAKLWNNGSVIRGWLMELAQSAFSKDKDLSSIKGIMNSSGEGKWTVETALDLQVPAPVIALSLMMRYRSLEEDTFTGKVVAALRNEFGGHEVKKNK
ncbi:MULTISPECIES: phosphogluconate dehydrogenase (NAD(+)-dependent, decarboxylating) [Clostridium]|uniref:6-phosphogluconate dehydrogenase (Decarboxylating) n=1 Tax=Clostridium botulinum (strain Eklund 17B / Type B) TaxID=935198 RepID=B2TJ94_CLOBB|nr:MULTISPECIES: decarboxylating 6-phosphogluconate dehydrogenase [Clostridium]ACD23977.1 6-phosphogluconate dehydrogenase (decarboxylating) [Clostridium botulinum B str. Eklund 17B (NRP)]MBN1054891.1 decarboxylating 6-phosphogluconate dehydrogenase [Clostridium botulinum]MBY6974866.1 decarboxylating 6-phosphogluconate dehydrogenase [Clostridium botulinum]MBY6999846.1 decarboxylating 6-phosphogluconate dehydrogenase [Clostridium botulinum]MCR1274618.1 decarboxylating 6-phosphogluconate dehydro